MLKINLSHKMFAQNDFEVLSNSSYKVSAFKYESGVEALKIQNSRGYLIVLPFEGLIIWDAFFNNTSLKMKDMFSQPYPGENIADTYGCFQFTSGLLANGTPAPDDTHPLHGEFSTSPMDKSWIIMDKDTLKICSSFEYVKGFGYHYLAEPSVTMNKDSALFKIEQQVTNLSEYQPMPIMYMCHMNYAFAENGKISSNIPNEAFTLRQSVPGHVHPTKEWLDYNEKLKKSEKLINILDKPEKYDPEIVYFADNISQYVKDAEFKMKIDSTHTFVIKFPTDEFNVVTRWLLYNPDQQVAAFALPGTNRPEGYNAAVRNNSLQHLAPKEKRNFTVITGIED